MSRLIINTGTLPNDRSGDSLHAAFIKVNSNFQELYTLTGGSSAALTELAQDYAIPLFLHNQHTNISFTYDDVNNKIIAVVADNDSMYVTTSNLTSTLNSYATQTYVTSQGYLTSVPEPTRLINQSHTLSIDTNGTVQVTGGFQNATSMDFYWNAPSSNDSNHWGSFNINWGVSGFMNSFQMNKNNVLLSGGSVPVNVASNGKVWTFGNNIVTVPADSTIEPADGSINVTAGATVPTLKDNYVTALEALAIAFSSLQGESGYPWNITIPLSYSTYGELLYTLPNSFTGQAAFTQQAHTVQILYNTWQAALTSQAVKVNVGANTWTFGANGTLGLVTPNNNIFIGDTQQYTSQVGGCIAIGNIPGLTNQGSYAIAVGTGSGNLNQGQESIAIGTNTSTNGQGIKAVAIGSSAGRTFQGDYAIAIGYKAGNANQPARTIMLNATNSILNGVASQTDSFYVNPIRNDNTATKSLLYNTTTKEVTYGDRDAIIAGNYSLYVSTNGIVTFPTIDNKTLLVTGNQLYALGSDILVSTQNGGDWTFGDNGNLTLPGNIQGMFNEDITISTSGTIMTSPPGPQTFNFSFGSTGILTVPHSIQSSSVMLLKSLTNSVEIEAATSIEISYQSPSVDVYIGAGGSGATTRLGNDRLQITSIVPATSKGSAGDMPGLIAVSNSYIYHCTGNYDGTTNIWKRVQFSADTW